MEPSSSNVLSVFESATRQQVERGYNWYPEAHNFARALDPSNISRAAGIIASFSPQCPWPRNQELACRLYETGIATGHTIDNCNKAQAIFNGADPLTLLGAKKTSGQKTRNFYLNILDPEDTLPVTIDGHAFDIAVGMQTTTKIRSILQRKGVYQKFADVYREVARELNFRPLELQAITWVTWRDSIGIT